MDDTGSTGLAAPSAEERVPWQTPTIDDYGIVATTRNLFSSGIDGFESSNPAGYGS